MKRFLFLMVAMVAMLIVGISMNLDAQDDEKTARKAQREANHEARQQRRAERLAQYEKYLDSLILSHNFRFVPQNMQQLPAGQIRPILNPSYEVAVWSDAVDVCIPFIKGYTPPYYPVVFNYVLPSVANYTTEQTPHGWNVSFSSSMYSATDYKFLLEISYHYGGAQLTISSPFYNSVQYSGNVFAL
jgi:hypothetical protein